MISKRKLWQVVQMLPREKLQQIVFDVHDALYPGGDDENHFDDSTADSVAKAIEKGGLGPEALKPQRAA